MDAAERQRFIVEHMPIVHIIVRKYSNVINLGVGIDRADLIQEGALALLQCYERYDPAKDNTFRNYCYQRVHGAIIDYLRDHQGSPRTLQKMKKTVQNYENEFMQQHKAMPKREDYAAALDMTVEKWDKARVSMEGLLTPVCLSGGNLNPTEIDKNTDKIRFFLAESLLVDSSTVEAQVESRETAREIHEAIDKLPPPHRAAIRGKYFEHTLARETAKKLNIKTEQITYLNRQGLLLLRGLLAHLAPPGVTITVKKTRRSSRVF